MPSLSLSQGGESRVRYQVAADSDPSHQFDVDETGTVRLVGGLDRETADTHSVLLWAVDDGSPRRTATGILTVSIQYLRYSESNRNLLISLPEVDNQL